MMVRIPCGGEVIELDVPEKSVIIEPGYHEALADEKKSAINAFRNPIGSPPLRELFSPEDRVVIVTCDNTRPLPNKRIIPWIFEELNFIPVKNFTVVLGTGSHRPCTEAEIETMFGREIADSIEIINHNAFDMSTMRSAGKIASGEEIFLNSSYIEADKRITLGFIEPHFFAGFSGGPKALMPGIAAIENIMQFHSFDMISNASAAWGIMDGNPLQVMAAQSASLVKPDFSINVTLTPKHKITGFFCGDLIEAHRRGAEFVKKTSMTGVDAPFDIVITSNSGHPLDRNFYQAVKGICAAGEIIKDGGSIICIAECGDGIPDNSEFHEIMRKGSNPDHLLGLIKDPSFPRMEAWQAQKLASVLTRAEVHLFSSIPPVETAEILCTYCENPSETLKKLLIKNSNARIAVLVYGPLSIPYLKKSGGV